jgi:hypothetical protein
MAQIELKVPDKKTEDEKIYCKYCHVFSKNKRTYAAHLKTKKHGLMAKPLPEKILVLQNLDKTYQKKRQVEFHAIDVRYSDVQNDSLRRS